jgi:hypothetical protein
VFAAIALVSDRTGLGFISSLESRGNAFGFRLLQHFNYYRVYALFLSHLYSFKVRY